MHLNPVGSLRLRRYAVIVAICAFALVIAGGLVTSNDAALSVPDWPLSWGQPIPTLEGGIRYEFAHRALAALVGLLTLGLAIAMRGVRGRSPLDQNTRRRGHGGIAGLGWAAFGTVVAQAILGGATVKLVTPLWATISHAALGQLFFVLLVTICVGLYGGRTSLREWHTPSMVCAAALFLQTLLGAGVRYEAVAPAAHIAGAVLATGLVMWAGLSLLIQNMDHPAVRRPATLLLSITFSQVFLGIGAMMARVAYLGAPQPMPIVVLFTVAHVAVGSLAVGAAVALAMLARPDSVGVHGGMVTAC